MVRLVMILLLAVAGTAAAQPGDETPRPMREKEILHHRTSGFWTSNRPAKHPYRWRLLGIGGGLLGVTGLLTWRLVRKAARERRGERAGRAGAPSA